MIAITAYCLFNPSKLSTRIASIKLFRPMAIPFLLFSINAEINVINY